MEDSEGNTNEMVEKARKMLENVDRFLADTGAIVIIPGDSQDEAIAYAKKHKELGTYFLTSDMDEDELRWQLNKLSQIATRQVAQEMLYIVDEEGESGLYRNNALYYRNGKCYYEFEQVNIDLSEDAQRELRSMMEAQAGRYIPGGYYRVVPMLGKAGITNCPYCGKLWVSRTANPVKCPECQGNLQQEWSLADIRAYRAPVTAPVFTGESALRMIKIGHVIVDRDIDNVEGDKQAKLTEKRGRYDQIARPMVEGFRAEFGGLPDQLVKSMLEKYLEERGLLGFRIETFPFWGGGYARSYVGAVITKPRSGSEGAEDQGLPQLVVRIGVMEKNEILLEGVEVGLEQDWGVPDLDASMEKIRSMPELDPTIESIAKDFGEDISGEAFRTRWPYVHLRKFIKKKEVSDMVVEDIKAALDKVMPLFEELSKLTST